MLALYSYFRSSAAYRVRIALALKGLAYETRPVHLLRDGGEQLGAAFRTLNPQALVPVLEHDGAVIGQSLAIVEYLDEVFPEVPLFPAQALQRALARQIALAVACDIHPLNNLRVLRYLQQQWQVDEPARTAWIRHWITVGLDALEVLLRERPRTGFCLGETPTLADCCLVPQAYNAERFGLSMDAWPHLAAIVRHCSALPAFRAAAPEAQPDTPPA